DKNYIDTAIRECYEEIGVESNKVKILGSMNILIAVIGVIIEPVIALLKIKSINELIINKDEVESVFTLPISYFYTNRPEEYYLRVEILPKITNENGENITLLPVKELGISSYYENPWGHNKHKVYVYKTPYGTIWGITAEIIHELINSIY
ncbi:MAG: hypothetical protein JXR64_05000, partial [Spirochaetales bacterium]|nr:hypothetical protein [Spirochaetales bacterium]